MSATTRSDKTLVVSMLAGDAEAFDSFFENYFPRLFRFALTRLNGNENAAEDVAQATLCKAVAKLATYRGEAALFYVAVHVLPARGERQLQEAKPGREGERARRGLARRAGEDSLDHDGDGNVSELVPVRDALGALVYTQDFGDVSNRNTARWPTYARLDARFSYHSGGGEGAWLFYFELLNLLNRDNALVVSPTIAFGGAGRPSIQEEHVSSFPLIPNFGFRFRF